MIKIKRFYLYLNYFIKVKMNLKNEMNYNLIKDEKQKKEDLKYFVNVINNYN